MVENQGLESGKQSALRQSKTEKNKNSSSRSRKIGRALCSLNIFCVCLFLQAYAKAVEHSERRMFGLQSYTSGNDFLFGWTVLERAVT